MRDFAAELDQRLRGLVLEAPAPATVGSVNRGARRPVHGASRPSRPRGVRRPALLGTAAALTTVAASAVLLSGTGATTLPVLGVPTSDASALKGQAVLSTAGVDFDKAHAIRTASGTGAVLATPSGQQLCLYLADAAIPDRAGGGARCAATDRVERDGLLVVGQGVTRPGEDSFSGVAFILPVDASRPSISEAGRTTAATVKSGVVFAQTRHAATLRYTTGGHSRAVHLPALFPPETTVQCNGKIRKLRTRPGSTPDAPRTVVPEQTCK